MRRYYGGTRRGLYRSRHGAILGVCRGISDYYDISLFWTRAVMVGLLLITGIWPIVGLYILAAIIMKPEPVLDFRSEDSREFYDSYVHSRSMALNRLKRTFDSMSRRLQRMEDIVTDKEFDWERRFNR